MNRTCLHCGTDFEVTRTNPKKKYCSLTCANRAKNEARSAAMPICTCKHCGQEFRPNERKYTTFCSRECFFAWQQTQVKPKSHKPMHKCKVCGKDCQTHGAQLCSDECRKALARQKARKREVERFVSKRVKCKVCGKEFSTEYGHPRTAFCSKRCAGKDEGKTLNTRARKALRRRYGSVLPLMYQPIRKATVLKRDHWTCGICGQPIDRHATAPEPLSASVDHIIALAVGGSHTYDNVQAAHFECNWRKGTERAGATQQVSKAS